MHFVFSNFFFENCVVYQIMKKYIAQTTRPHTTIYFMRLVCWIPNVTNTHSEYTIFTAFPLQQRLHERASVLRLYVYFLSFLTFSGLHQN
jgi:hypothetical protein